MQPKWYGPGPRDIQDEVRINPVYNPVCPESTRSLPGVYPESTRSLPGVYPESTRSLPGVYPESTLSLWHRQLDAPMLGGPSDPSDQGLRQCTKRANRSQPMATKLHATGPAAATAATGAATCCRISGHRNVRNTSRIGVKTSKVFILERFQDITLNKVSLHPYRLR